MEYTLEDIQRAGELYPTLWIDKYEIKNEAGLPLEFENHKFLEDIYNDLSPLQVVLKAPQIGMTVLQIIKTLYCAKKKGWDIIYTLPTASDVNDMAGGKINRIIAQNPVLMEWVKDHNTVEQKAVGDQIVYYRGTYSNKQAMMVSSDLNVHDEVDASDAGVIEQYETRLQAKADGRRWYFSHPSATDVGVDKYWQISDQKHWFITCESCHEQQYLSFPESINIASRCYVCKVCGAIISDDMRRNGKWVAKYSLAWQKEHNANKPFSGYWISQLMCPWITAGKIIDDYHTKSSDYFYNYVLGLPYSGGDAKLTQQLLFQNLTNKTNQAETKDRIVIGIDTGKNISYVLGSQTLGLFYHAEDKNYQELDKIMKQYPKAIAVMDAGGDFIGAREFIERWAGRAFLCYTNSKFEGKKEIWKWGEGDKQGQVNADRDKTIQLVVDEFRTKRIALQGTENDWWEYWLDWKNVSKIKLYDNQTNAPKGFKWVRAGRDHKAMATVYWRIGIERFKEEGATFHSPGSANDFAFKGIESH